MISQELKDLARGRWRDILIGLGVDGKILNGLHQPCPFCGGVDRFRFTDHEDDGGYYCNQCGSGTAFHLAAKALGKNYAEICREVEEMVGKGNMPRASEKAQETNRRIKAEKVQKIWDDSVPLVKDDPVCKYLIGRGLSKVSTSLRLGRVFDGESGQTFTSMVAEIQGPDGEMVGIHITHLMEVEGKWIKARIKAPKKQRKIADTISGGAIRLYSADPDQGIGICEGIETALAVRELWDSAVWSVMNATGIEKFQLPNPRPRILTIYADNDKNFVGMKAAYNLANRLVIKDDYHAIFVEQPMAVGDYLDELNGYVLKRKK